MDNNQGQDSPNEEVDLFGQEVSPEVLDAYMNENFDNEAQASVIAALAATTWTV
jgi:hypothetical protein